MIEKAFVCGQIAQALFKEENQLFLLHAEENEKPIYCTPYEESLFFDSDAEIKIFENISLDELRKKLLKDKLLFDVLHDIIAGFDRSLSIKTRILSMQKAEKFIKEKDPEILSFMKSRLFGNPVPREADLEQAVKLSGKNSFQYINSLYSQMLKGSEILNYISKSFKELIFEYSLENKYTKIKNIFITSGFFASLFFETVMNHYLFINEGRPPTVYEIIAEISSLDPFSIIKKAFYEFCADERERENIVKICSRLCDKLKKEYKRIGTPPHFEKSFLWEDEILFYKRIKEEPKRYEKWYENLKFSVSDEELKPSSKIDLLNQNPFYLKALFSKAFMSEQFFKKVMNTRKQK